MNEPESLKEVWKWKEDVYRKTKDMSKNARIKFFNKGLEDFMKRTGIVLRVEKRVDMPR